MNQRETLQNRQFRGQIMRVVAMFYPSPVTIKQLKLALQEYGLQPTADIDKYIHYLADDADKHHPPYIRCEQGFLKDLVDDDKVYITKAGIQLIEGTKEDVNILL